MLIEKIPTQLPPEQNAEFRKVYKQEFQVSLTTEQANQEAYRWLIFYATIIDLSNKYDV